MIDLLRWILKKGVTSNECVPSIVRGKKISRTIRAVTLILYYRRDVVAWCGRAPWPGIRAAVILQLLKKCHYLLIISEKLDYKFYCNDLLIAFHLMKRSEASSDM